MDVLYNFTRTAEANQGCPGQTRRVISLLKTDFLRLCLDLPARLKLRCPRRCPLTPPAACTPPPHLPAHFCRPLPHRFPLGSHHPSRWASLTWKTIPGLSPTGPFRSTGHTFPTLLGKEEGATEQILLLKEIFSPISITLLASEPPAGQSASCWHTSSGPHPLTSWFAGQHLTMGKSGRNGHPVSEKISAGTTFLWQKGSVW